MLADGRLRAVILNSGGANACTGPEGFADTHRTAELVASPCDGSRADVGAVDVAVCSTGLIGVRLPMDKITAGIAALVPQLSRRRRPGRGRGDHDHRHRAKQASFADEGWSVGGMAKGAGMLAPGLATMLVVITTDAVVDPERLPDQLAEACRTSFDRVDSDGCMSTNDTVLLLSSGASGVRPAPADFQAALNETCHDLALQLLRGCRGRGPRHRHHRAARGDARHDAVEVGRAIARSNLFKCAVFGRTRTGAGCSPRSAPPRRTSSRTGSTCRSTGSQVCRDGGIGEPRELVDLSGREVSVVVNLRNGSHSATVWTNDLTYDYVKENAEYST